MTQRTAQAAATRAKILETTVAALEAGGDDAVRVAEIVAAAGVSTGALYHHFGGREGLVVAARVEQFRAALPPDVDALVELVATATSVEEFRAGMRRIARLAHGASRARNRSLRADVIGAAHGQPALADALAEEQHAHAVALEAMMRKAQERSFLARDLDPHAVAVLFQGLSFGLILSDLDTIEPLDEDRWGELIGRLIDAVLAP
ncbi:MAG: TetR/AcrR family transcriptional regulator [Acidimicrobiia bacterium]